MQLKPLARIAKRHSIITGILLAAGISLTTILPTWARPARLTAQLSTSEINVRVNPSARSDIAYRGNVGDRVDIIRETQAADGYIWDYVSFDQSGARGWVRSDLVSSIVGAPSSKVKSPAVLKQPSPAISVIPETYPVQAPSGEFTPQQISYFLEIALGAEFSKSSSATKIRKWQGDVNIQYFGSPTSADLATLNSIISEVNDLTNGGIHLQLVDRNPNVTIHFSPLSQFAQLEPNYQPGNYGYFWTRWDENNKLNNANILITTTKVTQKERSHLIREELTQSLGLMQDSYKYADSMFYQPWTDVTQYSAIDRSLIRMLYDPQISPGMTQAQVMSVLNTRQAHAR